MDFGLVSPFPLFLFFLSLTSSFFFFFFSKNKQVHLRKTPPDHGLHVSANSRHTPRLASAATNPSTSE